MEYLKCYTCKQALVSAGDPSLAGTHCPSCRKGVLEEFKKNEPGLLVILPTIDNVKNKRNPKPRQRQPEKKYKKKKRR